MKNEPMDQLKNLVAFNAAIAEADEEIQMVQKKMNIHGHDKKYVSALNELKQKIVYYRYQKVKICLEVYDQIETLEDEQEKRILKYRYIKEYQWDVIANKVGYSERQIYNIHKRALVNLDLRTYN